MARARMGAPLIQAQPLSDHRCAKDQPTCFLREIHPQCPSVESTAPHTRGHFLLTRPSVFDWLGCLPARIAASVANVVANSRMTSAGPSFTKKPR